jgi:hypothetical protein
MIQIRFDARVKAELPSQLNTIHLIIWAKQHTYLHTFRWIDDKTSLHMPEIIKRVPKTIKCRLGGLMVRVLATGPNVHGFKPGRGDGFL